MGSGGGGGCSESEGCSRLCRLIVSSLNPFALKFFSQSSAEELGPSFHLTKDTEKDLLISLSLVYKEVQRWMDEIGFDTEQEDLVKMGVSVEENGKVGLDNTPFGERHSCLSNIICLLVSFLTVESEYVPHLAGKIIVVTSNFLTKSVSKWAQFIHLLWISFEVAICSWLSSSSPDKTGILVDENLVLPYLYIKDETFETIKDSDNENASLIKLLRSRLSHPSSLAVTSLLRVLRNIQKSLKNDSGELTELYMKFSVSSLMKVPWDCLHEIYVARNGGALLGFSRGDFLNGKVVFSESNDIILGTLLQLFCSLVEQDQFEELGGSSLNELYMYSKVATLLPKLFSCCFSKPQRYSHLSIYPYLRHKALMIMIRLSFQVHWQCSALVLCLRLLRCYFEDLLYKSISKSLTLHDNLVEGSPFLSSFTGGENEDYSCSHHLQRQAILLFLKCSFTLGRLSIETGQECAYVTTSSSFTCELHTQREHICSQGFSELSKWLQSHVSMEKVVDNESYLKTCSCFALSFLQLYMDEDDMLFEMLLQLLDAPYLTLHEQYNEQSNIFEEMNRNILFHISTIFSSVRLFHLLLSLLHYDYLVLLDYLISKDTGLHCVQYLLRCLRIICKSWLTFVEFSIHETEISHVSANGRKYFEYGQDTSGKMELLSSSLTKGIGNSEVLERQNMKRRKIDCMRNSTRRTFENAKECLLSLKSSVEDLHRKNLFPYNPTALLRSFTRFQELCQQQ